MVDLWFCLYIGVFWHKISHYLVPIIHIILFYYSFGVQKLVTGLCADSTAGKYSSGIAESGKAQKRTCEKLTAIPSSLVPDFGLQGIADLVIIKQIIPLLMGPFRCCGGYFAMTPYTYQQAMPRLMVNICPICYQESWTNPDRFGFLRSINSLLLPRILRIILR